MEDTPIKLAARLISSASAIIITSGAGMGVDSCLDTFRGRNAPKEGGPDPYAMSKHSTMCQTPYKFWGYQLLRHESFIKNTPHIGYKLLLEMGSATRYGVACYTSNIDGHWRRSIDQFTMDGGEACVPLVECHGATDLLQCADDCSGELWTVDHYVMDATVNSETGKIDKLPKCRNPECEEMSRFNVKLIGDNSFNSKRVDMQCAEFDAFKKYIDGNVVIVEVGAGTGIPTIRQLSASLANSFKASLIRINLDDFEFDNPVDLPLQNTEDTLSVGIGGLSAMNAIQQIYDEWSKINNIF